MRLRARWSTCCAPDHALVTSVLGRPSGLSFLGSNFLSSTILAIRSTRFITLRFAESLPPVFRERSRLIVKSFLRGRRVGRRLGSSSGLVPLPVRLGEVGPPAVVPLPDHPELGNPVLVVLPRRGPKLRAGHP